nr:BspA family leucine-rich repeat surface protein [Mycoplasmopsis bovis]
MEEMFLDATNFNGKIENWNVENVMFVRATKFSQDLSGWIFNHNYEYKNKVLKAWMENNK